jgi:hypothetical protein
MVVVPEALVSGTLFGIGFAVIKPKECIIDDNFSLGHYFRDRFRQYSSKIE